MLTTVCSYASNMRVLSTVQCSVTGWAAAARVLTITPATRLPDGQAQRQAVPSIMTTHLTTAILVWR